MALDIEKLSSLSNEARQAVAEAFDALEEWRVEIGAANERCLTKVFDQVTNAHRALGWTNRPPVLPGPSPESFKHPIGDD